RPRPCQGCQPWPRTSATPGLVLATQASTNVTGRITEVVHVHAARAAARTRLAGDPRGRHGRPGRRADAAGLLPRRRHRTPTPGVRAGRRRVPRAGPPPAVGARL